MSEWRMWAEDPVSCACSVVELPEVIEMEARSAAIANSRVCSDVATAPAPIALLGVPFDPITFDNTIDRIEAMIGSRRSHYVVTANVDFLVQARSDVELHRILLEADLVLCDGQPLVWASRWLGQPLPERVAGSDLVPELLRISAQKGYRVFFLGGSSAVAEQAVEKMSVRYPGLKVCGHYSPPYNPLLDMDHEEIARQIQSAQPDLLFVSLGCPKAEKWMFMHYRSLGVPVSIGVGGTIDFLAERLKRAPMWMRRCGIEWLFRLIQEPRRLYTRYARDAREFGLGLLQQFWHLQWRRPSVKGVAAASIELQDRSWRRIRPPEIFAQPFIARDGAIWNRALAHHCLVDLSHVRFIDSAGLGVLLEARRRLARQECCLVLLKPSARVRRAFEAMHVEHLFLIAEDPVHARELIQECIRETRRQISSTHPTLPLVWKGEIIAANATDRWALIQSQIDTLADSPEEITVDLSSVTFIDSTGVGLLLRALKYASNAGCALRFIDPSPVVRNVLRVSRLESVLLDPTPVKPGRFTQAFPFLEQLVSQIPSLKERSTRPAIRL